MGHCRTHTFSPSPSLQITQGTNQSPLSNSVTTLLKHAATEQAIRTHVAYTHNGSHHKVNAVCRTGRLKTRPRYTGLIPLWVRQLTHTHTQASHLPGFHMQLSLREAITAGQHTFLPTSFIQGGGGHDSVIACNLCLMRLPCTYVRTLLHGVDSGSGPAVQ